MSPTIPSVPHLHFFPPAVELIFAFCLFVRVWVWFIFFFFRYFTLHRFCIIFQGRRQSAAAAGVAYISIWPTGDVARRPPKSDRESAAGRWPFVQPNSGSLPFPDKRKSWLPQFCIVSVGRWHIKPHLIWQYVIVFGEKNGQAVKAVQCF